MSTPSNDDHTHRTRKAQSHTNAAKPSPSSYTNLMAIFEQARTGAEELQSRIQVHRITTGIPDETAPAEDCAPAGPAADN